MIGSTNSLYCSVKVVRVAPPMEETTVGLTLSMLTRSRAERVVADLPGTATWQLKSAPSSAAATGGSM